MASTDFFMNPKQLSVFYTDALKKAGHAKLVGWRSSPSGYQRGRSPGGVEILSADGTVFRVANGVLRDAAAPKARRRPAWSSRCDIRWMGIS